MIATKSRNYKSEILSLESEIQCKVSDSHLRTHKFLQKVPDGRIRTRFFKKFAPLPLKDVVVDAEVHGYLLGLKSTLTYQNDSPDPLEVVFRFPLEQSHTVVSLNAVIDGRKIRAEVKDKEMAKTEYAAAIASRQTAIFAKEKAGDIFSICLGNLPPGKEAEIVLQLVGELPIDAEEGIRFSLPSVLKPRYVPAGSSNPLEKVGGADITTSQQQIKQATTPAVHQFKLTILNQEDVQEVVSPTHSIMVEREEVEGGRVAVWLSAENQSLAKDLVISIKHKQPHSPRALVESGKEDGKDFMKQSAVMVNFFPEFPKETREVECEFVFLVDRSGSMSGSYINSARETLLLFLKSLPEGCHFNIVGFGSRYTKLFNVESVPYSQKTLDQATEHTKRMDADLGGTELLSPLKDILGQKPPSGLSRQVFVLTDGAVSNTSACIDVVRKNVHHSRCFTFGIGHGASSELVEGLARAGNGSAEFIKGEERMQPKVIRSLKRAIQPAVTNVSVEFKVESPARVKSVFQCPSKLPPVYAGEKLVVYGLMESPGDSGKMKGTAILKGSVGGKSAIKHTVSFSESSSSQSNIYPVHRLAAKALLADWQDANKPKEAIVSLSVESSVISRYTAFIGVDEESLNPVEGAMRTWDLMAKEFNGTKRIRGCNLEQKCVDSPLNNKSSWGGFLSFFLKPFMLGSGAELQGASGASQNSPGKGGAAPSDLSSPTAILSSLIASQQANGSWRLESVLAQILSKSMKEIESSCPVPLEGEEMKLVWATAVVLAILKKKCSGEKDEWELLALKAQSWLKKQALPTGVDTDTLCTAADNLL